MESYMQTYEDLKDRIVYGFYPYGMHLGIKQVSDDVEASRVMVQRALAKLVEDKLIIHNQSRGYFVIGSETCTDMLDYRNELELFAIRQAVTRITDEQYTALEELAEKVDSCRLADDLRKYVDIEQAFHRYIVQCSGNGFLLDMYEPVTNLYVQYISNVHRHLRKKDGSYSGMNIFISHRNIVDSIKLAQSKNMPEIAVKALDTHLSMAYSLDINDI